ncbi:MAG TPA: PHB depolymerase family esterase [Acidimicrobiales bacterium]|nr:PHB depolymerase family esterase [Acidimicrobiales bacterium]
MTNIRRAARTLGLATAVVAMVCSTAVSGGTAASAVVATPTAVATGAPVPSPGCKTAQPPSVTNQRQDIEVDGAARWYLLTTPAPTTPSPTVAATKITKTPAPRPLVVDIHGLAEGAVIHAQTSQFGVLGQKDGFVVAFPNGTGSPVQWNISTRAKPNPDLDFLAAMLNQVEASQCIDTSRVYASGFSDGAFMVSTVACTMSNRFAAIAAVSGLQLPTPCPTTRRVPILAFHGTADPILFFNGGVGIGTLNRALGQGGSGGSSTTTTTQPAKLHGAGYPATVRAWAVKDGCSPRSIDTKVASQIILRTYTCPRGTAVKFYIVLGGGHAWPGSKFSQSISSITGFTTFQINATNQIWAFFRQFRL